VTLVLQNTAVAPVLIGFTFHLQPISNTFWSVTLSGDHQLKSPASSRDSQGGSRGSEPLRMSAVLECAQHQLVGTWSRFGVSRVAGPRASLMSQSFTLVIVLVIVTPP
jgi:hypothetical protein